MSASAARPDPAPAPRTHVAVVTRACLDAILSGEKTIESRLSRTRCAPFGRVSVGDSVYFKQSSGPFRARATVRRVKAFHGLSAAGVARLRSLYNAGVRGSPAYWRTKRDAGFATMIWLDEVRAVDEGPSIPALYGRAWIVLPAGGLATPRAAARTGRLGAE
ncbi:MAG TPA: ASCH domain-containing protein [Phycisphaerales bacterium]|nr:ASCH domain-containing protein [Phycisphaerales bacterium]